MDASTVFLVLIVTVITVNGQITTPCTMSMIRGFTPCVNYITGSIANGKSPTASCCDAMESLMTTSMDCTCLIVTGNVPFSLPNPINQALAISLPQACNSKSMPFQCNASGVSLPPPGPMLFAPPPPKAFAPIAYSPEYPPSASVSEIMEVARTLSEMTHDVSTEATEPSAPVNRQDPRIKSGMRPVVTASSASNSLLISFTLISLVTVATTFTSFC